jgi:hypothetical protein
MGWLPLFETDGYEATNFWGSAIFVRSVSNISIISTSITGSSTGQGIGVDLAGAAGTACAGGNCFGVVYNIIISNFNGLANGINYGTLVQGVTVASSNFTRDLVCITIPGVPWIWSNCLLRARSSIAATTQYRHRPICLACRLQTALFRSPATSKQS